MITYIVSAACELVWIFCYGFFLNSFMPRDVFFFAAFGIPFCVNMIFYKKLPFKDKVNKMLWVLILSLIMAGLSILLYDALNRASGEFVDEYDVSVVDCYHKNGGTAYFKDRDGQDASVELRDYRIVIPDDDYVTTGDTITVREYVGFFGETFYVFVEEVK